MVDISINLFIDCGAMLVAGTLLLPLPPFRASCCRAVLRTPGQPQLRPGAEDHDDDDIYTDF